MAAWTSKVQLSKAQKYERAVERPPFLLFDFMSLKTIIYILPSNHCHDFDCPLVEPIIDTMAAANASSIAGANVINDGVKERIGA